MAAVEVMLTSKDEREFKVDAYVAIMSETVKSMMGVEDGEDIDPPEAAIPLPAVEGNILELVIKYCDYHFDNKETKEDEKNTWDQEFVKVDDDTLFSLILAANYLDIKSLLDLTCKTVADYIKQCKTPQEIRRRFNIKNGELHHPTMSAVVSPASTCDASERNCLPAMSLRPGCRSTDVLSS